MTLFGKYYKKRRVLVTGGAGFIGSLLTQKLVDAGAAVTILDNFSSGATENLEPYLHRIKVISGDITDKKTCDFSTQKQEIIFHLAAAISVQESAKNPTKYIKINVDGTQNLLESAVKAHVQRFVFSSSAAVYGNQNIKCHEQLPLSPTSIYAETKIAGEKLCTLFRQKYGLETIVLRYFNVYGEKQRIQKGYGAVIPLFKEKLLQKKPITIFGNGLQTRDFISVDEVVQANMLAGCNPYPAQPIINVASGISKTMLQLLGELVEQLKCEKPIVNFAPERPGDVVRSEADCDRYLALKKIFEGNNATS